MNDTVFMAVSCLMFTIVGIIIGLALADTSSGTTFLKDWQPLVTGILAVAAAIFTIVQMRRSDRLQGRRHEQVIALSLRSDALKIQQASDPLAKLLKGWADETQSRLEAIKKEIDSDDPQPPRWESIDLFESKVRQIEGIIACPELDYAKSLLDPSTLNLIENIRAKAPSLAKRTSKIMKLQRNGSLLGNAKANIRARQGRAEKGEQFEPAPPSSDELDQIRADFPFVLPVIEYAQKLSEQLEFTNGEYSKHLPRSWMNEVSDER
ncbi:hypothetical protein H7H48_17065 [Nitratireductor sp. B36]|uniref:hypothetical protein n=1 Tax=Nitratireductor sp. B36 TaxID=2762059 RepID=UPI001E63E21D|nr:hypothetical protein [Nitratireductor sp. B36]MCC5780776.1 hypothetical protein [Nitratireductor sp. B36]